MLFRVAGPDAVHELRSDSELQEAIGGVSVFRGLVDADLVTWVHAHGLVILAWTVNDSENFNQLVLLGVDGITTNNLAILRALGRPASTHLSGRTAGSEEATGGLMSAPSEPDLDQELGPIYYLAVGLPSAHGIRIVPAASRSVACRVAVGASE